MFDGLTYHCIERARLLRYMLPLMRCLAPLAAAVRSNALIVCPLNAVCWPWWLTTDWLNVFPRPIESAESVSIIYVRSGLGFSVLGPKT